MKVPPVTDTPPPYAAEHLSESDVPPIRPPDRRKLPPLTETAPPFSVAVLLLMVPESIEAEPSSTHTAPPSSSARLFEMTPFSIVKLPPFTYTAPPKTAFAKDSPPSILPDFIRAFPPSTQTAPPLEEAVQFRISAELFMVKLLPEASVTLT